MTKIPYEKLTIKAVALDRRQAVLAVCSLTSAAYAWSTSICYQTGGASSYCATAVKGIQLTPATTADVSIAPS